MRTRTFLTKRAYDVIDTLTLVGNDLVPLPKLTVSETLLRIQADTNEVTLDVTLDLDTPCP